jgi:manganese transport protein
LTQDHIKYSLVVAFNVVNINNGALRSTRTRNRTVRRGGNLAALLVDSRHARRSNPTLAARSAPLDPYRIGRQLDPQDSGVCRTRVSRRGWLHGPGELGHGYRWRIEIRLHTPQRETGRDLAQACREHYSRRTSMFLWIVCEIAIAACDLAEVLGSAIALKLLFGLPLIAGVLITALDVLIVLALQGRGFRLVEAFVVTLIASIAACFAYEIFWAQPLWREAARGFVPHLEILRNREMLYIAIGILGATVMPHNLYLHSSIVQTRAFGASYRDRREALRYAIFDSTVALGFALFVNAAILVLGAAAFHTRGLHNVGEIADAYKLLSPVLGVGLASTVFAVALLASGQNSTLTGTLAGQIVMEGFLEIRLKPWLRRLITRSIAIIPAVIVIGIAGEGKVTALLILSQVVLSFQLPFAVIPLIQFTGNRKKMGGFTNSRLTGVVAWVVAAAILFFNGELLYLIFRAA